MNERKLADQDSNFESCWPHSRLPGKIQSSGETGMRVKRQSNSRAEDLKQKGDTFKGNVVVDGGEEDPVNEWQ